MTADMWLAHLAQLVPGECDMWGGWGVTGCCQCCLSASGRFLLLGVTQSQQGRLCLGLRVREAAGVDVAG